MYYGAEYEERAGGRKEINHGGFRAIYRHAAAQMRKITSRVVCYMPYAHRGGWGWSSHLVHHSIGLEELSMVCIVGGVGRCSF